MKDILWIIIVLIVMFGSAIKHEADLSRNFNETGDAKAWFYDIKIVE